MLPTVLQNCHPQAPTPTCRGWGHCANTSVIGVTFSDCEPSTNSATDRQFARAFEAWSSRVRGRAFPDTPIRTGARPTDSSSAARGWAGAGAVSDGAFEDAADAQLKRGRLTVGRRRRRRVTNGSGRTLIESQIGTTADRTDVVPATMSIHSPAPTALVPPERSYGPEPGRQALVRPPHAATSSPAGRGGTAQLHRGSPQQRPQLVATGGQSLVRALEDEPRHRRLRGSGACGRLRRLARSLPVRVPDRPQATGATTTHSRSTTAIRPAR